MRKKLKFWTVLTIVTVMLFSMAACDNGEVPEPEEKSYSVTVVDGVASVSSATAGTVVTLTANSKTGHGFAGWTSDVTGLAIENNSFVMPASNVNITAKFNKLSYTLTVTGGTAEVGGIPVAGNVEYGAEVVLTPDSTEPGHQFLGWTGDVTVTDNKFSMPAQNVSLTANLDKLSYGLTVAGGTAKVDGTPVTGNVEYGAEVVLTPDAAEQGYVFSDWTGDVTVTDNKFSMPAQNVSITANFSKLSYTLTVEGGTAEVGGIPVTGSVEYGAEVVLTPDAPEQGYVFSGWTGDVTVTDNKFSMPAKNVSLTANFELDGPYLLTISGDGVTFKDSSKVAEVMEGNDFPEFVNNNEGIDVAGWYDVNDTSSYWKSKTYDFELRKSSSSVTPSFVMPSASLTVAPFFSAANQRVLIPASTIDTNSALTEKLGNDFYETDIGTQIGTRITYSGGIYDGATSGALDNVSNGFFRILTACATDKTNPDAVTAGDHIFYYWFKNLGSEAMTFTVYQGGSGRSIYGSSSLITLEQNQSIAVTVNATGLGENANALTLLAFSSDHTVTNADFAMVMSMDVPLKYSLSLDANSAVTFADGNKTKQIFAGSALPEIINNNAGTDIAGWYEAGTDISSTTVWSNSSKPMNMTEGQTTVMPSFSVPSRDITIVPFFVEAGMRPLVVGGGNNIGTSQNGTSDRTKTLQFFNTDLGLQFGQVYTYAGTGSSGTSSGYFRILTRTANGNDSSSVGAMKAGDQTFSYWLKNMGTETLMFQVYQSTSGATPILTYGEGVSFSSIITLAEGESTRITIKVSVTANANIGTVIFLRQNQTAAKLAIVMSMFPDNVV